MNMTVIKLINAVLIIVLLLLLRKLIWCLRCLWCHYHGREMPPPITFIPQQSGRVFERHVADAAPVKQQVSGEKEESERQEE